MNPRSLLRCLALFVVPLCAPPVSAAWSLPEGAAVHSPYRGVVPAKSDVIFSTRFKRDKALPVATAFGATRIEWVHVWDPDYVTQLKTVAPWFGGSINANGPLPSDDGMARNFDGEVLVPPWMKGWGAKWVTTTHPDTQRVMAEQLAGYLAEGADSIQFDDAVLQYHGALHHGGDFNPSTQAGFKRYLATYPNRALLRELGLAGFDGSYRDYLRARHKVKNAADYKRRFRTFPSTPLWLAYIQSTVAEHYVRLRQQADAARSKKVPFSMNMFTLLEPDANDPYFNLAAYADYSMPETDVKDIVDVVSMAATARALRIGWAPSIRPLGLAENRAVIASLYALGGQPIVPWDVYDGNDADGKAKRFFGSPEQYADLYRFVRANRASFDGLEMAAVVGIVVAVDRYDHERTGALVRSLVERQIPFAFVPVGGSSPRYAAESERLKNFKLLVTPNADADYGAETLTALQRSGVSRIGVAQIDSATLDRMRPFLVAPGADTVRLYPRALPNRPNELVVHVIDTTRAAVSATATACRRRLGIRNEFLTDNDVESATWITPAGSRRIDLERSPQALFVSIDDCPLWGLLKLQLRR